MKKPPADMLTAAKAVLPNAYAPYSHFSVAACVRAENGLLFSGCNVENAASPVGMCAEVGAISALFTHGYKKVSEALVLVPDTKICSPCGACRQRFLECASPEISIHLCTLDGQYQHCTLEELLPFAFGPNNLEL
ncbi:MAG: cytidine deaminase [Gammaproteobacteria bacterium]|nr:cytidine deaminase [Gammaproteobacteria bacterium]